MHRRLIHRCPHLCVALAAGLLTSSAGAGPTDAAFAATIHISEQVAPANQPIPCFLIGTISGNGVATKLGAVTLESTDCINPLTPEFTSFVFSSMGGVVLTTMNGDEVMATYTGVLSSNGVINGTFVIHGGTGRTANATGSGILRGFEAIDLATGTGGGQIRLEGTISY